MTQSYEALDMDRRATGSIDKNDNRPSVKQRVACLVLNCPFYEKYTTLLNWNQEHSKQKTPILISW